MCIVLICRIKLQNVKSSEKNKKTEKSVYEARLCVGPWDHQR